MWIRLSIQTSNVSIRFNWLNAAFVKWLTISTDSLYKFYLNLPSCKKWTSCSSQFLALCKWKNGPSALTSCDTDGRCLMTWLITCQKCLYLSAATAPSLQILQFFLDLPHSVSHLLLSTLGGKKKGWVISYVSSHHHKWSMLVKSLTLSLPALNYVWRQNLKSLTLKKFQIYSVPWLMFTACFYSWFQIGCLRLGGKIVKE